MLFSSNVLFLYRKIVFFFASRFWLVLSGKNYLVFYFREYLSHIEFDYLG